MYLVFIIFHVAITATGQTFEEIFDEVALNYTCLFVNKTELQTCIDLNVCILPLPFPAACVLKYDNNALCCQHTEYQRLDRDFSERNIINMCYDYYAKHNERCGDKNCICRGIPENRELYYDTTLGWRRGNNDYDFEGEAFPITRSFILTSAHYMDRGYPDGVRFNYYELGCQKYIEVDDVYIHPEYKPFLAYNDIAIVKLSKEADERIDSYCLWVDYANLTRHFLAVGYDYNDIVLEVNNEACNNVFPGESRLPNGIIDSQLCTAHPQKKANICQKNSSSLLFTKLTVVIKPECKIARDVRYVMGISSDVCSDHGIRIFTRVSTYVDWIDSIIAAPPIGNKGKINSSCLIHATGQQGIYVNITECPRALSNLLKISPETVFFENNYPIVCCPNEEQISTKVVKQNFSKSKIVNMCYNYYADISVTNSYDNFDENCIIQKFPYFPICQDPDLGIISDIISSMFPTPAKGFERAALRVPIEKYMYMATLGWKQDNNSYDFRCGAFLIAKNFVLTAAHCMRGGNPDIVRLGEKAYRPKYAEEFEVAYNVNMFHLYSETTQDIQIDVIYIHPDYNPFLFYNDIAIIKLRQEASEQFILACLWLDDAHLAPDLKAIGYGAIKHGGPTSDHLLQVFLNLMNNTVCDNEFSGDDRLPNGIISSQLCAGNPERKMDTCKGDSGGPLFTWTKLVFAPECREKTNVVHVLGITSFGQICGASFAGVYTRVSSYLDWIDSIVFGD